MPVEAQGSRAEALAVVDAAAGALVTGTGSTARATAKRPGHPTELRQAGKDPHDKGLQDLVGELSTRND